MKTVNPWAADHHLMDGVAFLKGFYRLSRLQGAVLLGTLDEADMTVEILNPDANLDPRIRAALVADKENNLLTNKKSVSSKWVDSLFNGPGEDADRSTTADSGIKLMPRLAHWTAAQLEADSRKATAARRKHAKSVGAASSTSSLYSAGGHEDDDLSLFEMDSAEKLDHGDVDDGSVVSALTITKTDHSSNFAITAMLPAELGLNPYEEWGLKESGFMPAWYHSSRPHTTAGAAPASGSQDGSSPQSTHRGHGRSTPHRSFVSSGVSTTPSDAGRNIASPSKSKSPYPQLKPLTPNMLAAVNVETSGDNSARNNKVRLPAMSPNESAAAPTFGLDQPPLPGLSEGDESPIKEDSNSSPIKPAEELKATVSFAVSSVSSPEAVSSSPGKSRDRSASPSTRRGPPHPTSYLPAVRITPAINEVVECLLARPSTEAHLRMNSKPTTASLSPVVTAERKMRNRKELDGLDTNASFTSKASLETSTQSVKHQNSGGAESKKEEGKEKVRELSRILRPSLPRTFSSIGLARQEVRDKLTAGLTVSVE
jgi:hypothetical protein